jgi:hypothetical protein
MRFCFELDPVDSIEPWGKGADRKLHWFGLTSGRYWISTPLGDVLRYTDAQINAWKLHSPYVDYQVARLFEDVQSILPAVLEPVPPDIAGMVAGERWDLKFESWIEGSSEDEERRMLFYETTAWYENRSLDTMYLTNGPLFHLWRTGESISVRWQQTGPAPVRVWTIPEGRFAIDAEEFRAQAGRFLDEVLRAMQERIDDIQAKGWNRLDCLLDIPLLLKEQEQRSVRVDELKQRSVTTDWGAVRSLMGRFPQYFFE